MASFWLAIASPLDGFASSLLTFHMIWHLLIIRALSNRFHGACQQLMVFDPFCLGTCGRGRRDNTYKTGPGAFLRLLAGTLAARACDVGSSSYVSYIDCLEQCVAGCATGLKRPRYPVARHSALDGVEPDACSGYSARVPDADTGCRPAALYAAGIWVFLQPMRMRGMVHG
jgi:hypothetical protein